MSNLVMVKNVSHQCVANRCINTLKNDGEEVNRVYGTLGGGLGGINSLSRTSILMSIE